MPLFPRHRVFPRRDRQACVTRRFAALCGIDGGIGTATDKRQSGDKARHPQRTVDPWAGFLPKALFFWRLRFYRRILAARIAGRTRPVMALGVCVVV
jgi:hypothetical protein